MSDKPTPATTSSDYDAMSPYWSMVGAIMGGSEAIRRCGEKYLPRFPSEPQDAYKQRLDNAVLSNIFADVVETLSAKPFADEIGVDTGSARIEALLENIDGQGNHIHVFAADWFEGAVEDAIQWVLVDYTKGIPAGLSIAQESELNARPYWVRIPARNLIAVYSEMIGGIETIVHARIREDVVMRDGYAERVVERVRELNRDVVYGDDGSAVSAAPATWTLHEKQKDKDGKEQWVVTSFGDISIGEIALVPLVTGKREGSTWRIRPPMAHAAYLQVEHYQQASAEKNLYAMAAFPMLAANGVDLPSDGNGNPLPLAIGPMAVLSSPAGSADRPVGEWTMIEPAGTSMDKISGRLERIERQIRELGRQPLTAQSGNITTVTAAFAGDKAMTVIEAWCLNAKDALENALRLTAKWLKEEAEPEVNINTDFLIGLKEDNGADTLDKARDRGDISQETYLSELKRRGILSANFDIEKERERIATEAPSDATDDEANAANMTDPNQQDMNSNDPV